MEEDLRKDLGNLVDVCAGPMTLPEINDEITGYMLTKQPELLVIEIRKDKTTQKYRTIIYVTKKDFDKKF